MAAYGSFDCKHLICLTFFSLNHLPDQPSSGQETGDSNAVRQLLTHVPDVVINCDHKKPMPRANHVVGVCMFADISGEVERL